MKTYELRILIDADNVDNAIVIGEIFVETFREVYTNQLFADNPRLEKVLERNDTL